MRCARRITDLYIWAAGTISFAKVRGFPQIGIRERVNQTMKIKFSNKCGPIILLIVFISVAVAAQQLTSLNASAKGKGIIKVSDIDQHKINSVMIILKESGDADFTFYTDLQLSAQGSWSVGESLSQGIDLKITGGVVSGNATGTGKLFLRKDGKSIDRLTIEAKSADGGKITVDFVADQTLNKNSRNAERRMTKLINKRIAAWAFVFTTVVFSLLATIDIRSWKLSHEGEAKSAKSDSKAQSRGETAAALSNGLGELRFTYDKRRRFRRPAVMHSALISQRALDAIVGELKKKIALPFDIRVLLEECGGNTDAYYDPDAHEITVCYDLLDGYYYLFSRELKARTARNEAAKDATVAVFLHEIAHALIDGWQLPITGREEDAADQFATLWLINGMPEGEQMALNSADEQRFYDRICLLYGHNPERYEYLIANGTLPAGRASECEEDYARINKSWQTLLAPHLVRPSGFDALSFLRALGDSSRMP